jgi:hypothetical protein
MAHFAKIENNIVTQVIIISNEDCNNLEFPESENIGKEFISSLNIEGDWIQTSYSASFRKKFAGVSDVYNEELDAFIIQKPFASWILNKETCLWEAPIPEPEDGNKHIWDEENQTWNSIIFI